MSQSLVSICLWTLVRTVVLCMIAIPICVAIERWMRSLSDAWRPTAFGLLLAPFLFPELLTGYACRDAALTSVQLAEWLCTGLLLIRIVPVGVIVLLVSPPSLSDLEAIYCRRILARTSPDRLAEWWRLVACYWQGPVRRILPAMSLMSLVAFQEFELAALLQTPSWTDWFIVSQRVGLDRSEMLWQSIWPILVQAPLLVAVVYWFLRVRDQHPDQQEFPTLHVTQACDWGIRIYLCLAIAIGCLFPLKFMASNLPGGIALIVRQPMHLTGLVREMLIAASVSLCAGMTAWLISKIVLETRVTSWSSFLLRPLLLLPGLAGSLLLGLAFVAAFQHPWLRPFYDTPVPWVMSLVVWLLPRAVLVRLWIVSAARTESVRLAELLSPGPRPAALLFRLRQQPQLLAMGLLCYWAYLDLSTACLLAPSGMPSGLVRLYNFMHFGRSSALSAEAILFFGLPFAGAYSAVRIYRAINRAV